MSRSRRHRRPVSPAPPRSTADGKFAGIALLKPVLVAGPANAGAQAVLVTSDTVRDFLKANGVSAAGASTDAKASVVRVICVRK